MLVQLYPMDCLITSQQIFFGASQAAGDNERKIASVMVSIGLHEGVAYEIATLYCNNI